MKKYTYVLYDEDEAVVAMFDRAKDLAIYLGKSVKYPQRYYDKTYVVDNYQKRYYLIIYRTKTLESDGK